jgi:hypothetical protein
MGVREKYYKGCPNTLFNSLEGLTFRADPASSAKRAVVVTPDTIVTDPDTIVTDPDTVVAGSAGGDGETPGYRIRS